MNNRKIPSDIAEIVIDNRLHLRQVGINEVNEMFNLVDNDREYLSEYLPFPEFTKVPKDSLELIKSIIQKRIDGTEYGFGIYLNNQLVGHTSIMHIIGEKEPEIGYWIASKAAGKGLTTKTTAALTNFGFNILGLKKIIIKADPKNTGSNRVAEKSGYEFNGTKNDEKLGLTNIWVIE